MFNGLRRRGSIGHYNVFVIIAIESGNIFSRNRELKLVIISWVGMLMRVLLQLQIASSH